MIYKNKINFILFIFKIICKKKEKMTKLKEIYLISQKYFYDFIIIYNIFYYLIFTYYIIKNITIINKNLETIFNFI